MLIDPTQIWPCISFFDSDVIKLQFAEPVSVGSEVIT